MSDRDIHGLAPAAPLPLKITLDALPPLRPELRTLGNGLEILVLTDRTAPLVSVRGWVRMGSMYEGEWLGAGLSHLVEHMLFKGTERRHWSDINQEAHQMGASINAHTNYDETVYKLDGPADQAAGLLDLMSDMLMHSRFDPEELTKEMEVIRREMAMYDDDPDDVGWRMRLAASCMTHPARHPIIGYRDVFDQLSREDIYGFYKRHYVPNNIFFVVVGDVEPEAIFRELERHWAPMPRARLPLPVPMEEPEQTSRREVTRSFATEVTKFHLTWRSAPQDHADLPALHLLADVLGGGLSARLYRALREERGLALNLDTHLQAMPGLGQFIVYGECEPEKAQDLIPAILQEIERLKTGGVTAEELEKARARALSAVIGTLTKFSSLASQIGGGWLARRDPDPYRHEVAKINRVTVANVLRVAEAYLTEQRLTVTLVQPPAKKAARPRRAKSKAPGQAVEKFTLSNGLTLLAREDRRIPATSLVSYFLGGQAAENPAHAGVAHLCGETIIKGTPERDTATIAETMESVGGSLTAGSSFSSLHVNAWVLSGYEPLALDLMGGALQRATHPAEVIEREIEGQLAELKEIEDDPLKVAMREFRQLYFGSLPHGRLSHGDEATVPRLDRAALTAYTGQVLQACNGVLAVCGAVNGKQIRDLAEKWLGGMPGGQRAAFDPSQNQPVPTAQRQRLQRAKEQGVVILGYPGTHALAADALAFDVITQTCSGMASPLFHRIREELGLAYYVSCSQFQGILPGTLFFYAGTSPDKVELVTEEIQKECRRLAAQGLDQAKFDHARKTMVAQHHLRLQTYQSLATVMAQDEIFGLGHDRWERYAGLLEALTLEDVNAVAARVLATEPVIVQVAPGSH